MGTQIHDQPTAAAGHPLQTIARFLLTALNIAACVVLGYLMWTRAPAWRAAALAASIVPIHIFSKIAWKAGDIFRQFVTPDAYFTSDVKDSLYKKIFWITGPQTIASFWTIFASWMLAVHLLNPKAVDTPLEEMAMTMQTMQPASEEQPGAAEGAVAAATESQVNPAAEAVSSAGDGEQRSAATPTTAPVTTPASASPPSESTQVTPSFDCATVNSMQEYAICTNTMLAQLDTDMASEYRYQLSVSKTPEQLRQDQLQWLKGKRGICPSIECLAETYRERIAALQAMTQ